MEVMISQLTVIALVGVIVFAVVKVFGSGNTKPEVDPGPEPVTGKTSKTVPIYGRNTGKGNTQVRHAYDTGTIFRRGNSSFQNEDEILIEQLDKDTNAVIQTYHVGMDDDKFIIERNNRMAKVPVLSIGRSSDADISIIDDSCYTGNFHGELRLQSGKLHYQDTSKNGTYDIREKKITETIINNQDIIVLDKVVPLKFYLNYYSDEKKTGYQRTQIRRW